MRNCKHHALEVNASPYTNIQYRNVTTAPHTPQGESTKSNVIQNYEIIYINESICNKSYEGTAS